MSRSPIWDLAERANVRCRAPAPSTAIGCSGSLSWPMCSRTTSASTGPEHPRLNGSVKPQVNQVRSLRHEADVKGRAPQRLARPRERRAYGRAHPGRPARRARPGRRVWRRPPELQLPLRPSRRATDRRCTRHSPSISESLALLTVLPMVEVLLSAMPVSSTLRNSGPGACHAEMPCNTATIWHPM